MKKLVFMVLLSAIVGGGLFYKFIYIPKSTYAYVNLKKGDFEKSIFATGIVDAKEIYNLSSDSNGKISKIFVKEGDEVKKNQILATIESIDMIDKIQESKFGISKAIANKDISLSKIQEAKAKYTQAVAMENRYAHLLRDGFISKVEYENMKLSSISAKSNIEALKSELIASLNEIQKLESTVEGLKKRLNNFNIIAPQDGIIISKDMEVGDTATTGKVILKVLNPDFVWVKTFVDEGMSEEIDINQSAIISLRSMRDKEEFGYVKKIEFISDSVTQERILWIAFNDIPKRFFLNEQAEIKIITQKLKNVFLINAGYIVKFNGVEGIWVYKEQKSEFIPVKLIGRSIDSSNVAIDGKLRSGDKILIPNESKKPLNHGGSVRI